MSRLRATIERVLGRQPSIAIEWFRRPEGSQLERYLEDLSPSPGTAEVMATIEHRAKVTQEAGPRPVWSGYGKTAPATRSPDRVRTSPEVGSAYHELVLRMKPELVVEFGTAFGVSGMYWLSALEVNGRGRLLTFDPNEDWQSLALENLTAIGTRFEMISGTFEENIDRCLSDGEQIDLAFVDAIHRSEFVDPQFDLVAERSRSGAVVVLDDINFSDDMAGCWKRLALDDRVRASAQIGRRVGIVELH